jgi:uncharacterized protein YqgC (DUF456 family)
MLNILLYILLFLVLLVGLAITVMTLPGLWIMLLATGLYAWATHFAFIGKWTLLILLAMAVLGEVIELGFQGSGAKRAGAGRRGVWGALIGGVLGGIFLSFIPIPVISTLVGVLLGTFTGAMIGELSGGRDVGPSAYVGFGAARGRFFGTLAKLGLGGIMLATTLWMALPLTHTVRAASTQPATAPTTSPSAH